MSKRTGIPWFVAVLLVLAALACSVPGLGGDTASPTPEPPATEVEPSPPPAGETPDTPTDPAPPAEPGADCPAPGEGTELFVNEEWGFCLLYPADYDIAPEWDQGARVLALLGEPLDPGAMESAIMALQVHFNGPADGLDAQGYFEMWEDLFLEGQEVDLQPQPVTISGQPAVLARNIPGWSAEQAAYLVVNGYKYRIVASPQPSDIPDITDEFNLLWNTVTESIVFFPPTIDDVFVRAEDVCPAATAGTYQHINLREGNCMLVPDGFSRDLTFGSGFNGPTSANIPGWGEMSSNLVLGTFGIAQGKTPRQVLEPWFETGIDPATVTDATIGGAPAVVFFDSRGPVASRQAMIVVNDRVYTIVNQPYYPQEFPELTAEVDLLWDTVTGSLAFFDPWR